MVLHVLFLMLLARFEAPLGLMRPSAQGEVVGVKARRPEDVLTHLASPGHRGLNQPEHYFWAMHRMPRSPCQGLWFLF